VILAKEETTQSDDFAKPPLGAAAERSAFRQMISVGG
jgi:hypothetical protein